MTEGDPPEPERTFPLGFPDDPLKTTIVKGVGAVDPNAGVRGQIADAYPPYVDVAGRHYRSKIGHAFWRAVDETFPMKGLLSVENGILIDRVATEFETILHGDSEQPLHDLIECFVDKFPGLEVQGAPDDPLVRFATLCKLQPFEAGKKPMPVNIAFIKAGGTPTSHVHSNSGEVTSTPFIGALRFLGSNGEIMTHKAGDRPRISIPGSVDAYLPCEENTIVIFADPAGSEYVQGGATQVVAYFRTAFARALMEGLTDLVRPIPVY